MSNFTKNWMSYLEDSRKLSELTLPGTHDSMTYTITKGLIKGLSNEVLEGIVGSLTLGGLITVEVIYRCTNCQTLTLSEQLEAGIRFLDIRLRKDGNKLEAYHGGIRLHVNFGEIQDTCVSFLKANPGETIIMSIKNEDKGRENTEDIYSSLWPSIHSDAYRDFWYTEDRIPCLAEVRKKVVLMRRFHSKTQPHPVGIDAWGGWPPNRHGVISHACTIDVQDVYGSYRLGQQDKKFNLHVKPQLEAACKDRGSDTLYLNFTSGTNGVYPRTLATGYMSSFKGTNMLLHQYLLNHVAGRYGIIAMDFPEYPNGRGLIRQLILSNDFSGSVSELRDADIYEIRSGLAVDSCLDVWLNVKEAGAEVKISRAHGGNNQSWKFRTMSHDEHGGRCGLLIPQSHPGLVLTADPDRRTGATVYIDKESPSNNNQLFLLQYSGEGYFTIKPHSDLSKALDAPAVNDLAFGDVVLSPCPGSEATGAGQEWKLQPQYYKDRARALHVYYSSSSNTRCYSLVQTPILKHANAGDYVYEGIIGYIFDEQMPGTVPFYEHQPSFPGNSPHYSLDQYLYFPEGLAYLFPAAVIGYVYPPDSNDLQDGRCHLYRWKSQFVHKELYTTAFELEPEYESVGRYFKDSPKYGPLQFDHVCVLIAK